MHDFAARGLARADFLGGKARDAARKFPAVRTAHDDDIERAIAEIHAALEKFPR